jgi:threonine synthase
VWGKKESVLPGIPDDEIISMQEGATHLFPADRLGAQLGVADLWVKLCGNSHTGSFKDLGMTVLVSAVNHIIQSGQDIDAVACASTGDTSAALAAYGAKAGIPTVVFLPANKVSPAQLVQPLANGALVLALETDFDGCMEIVQEITKSRNIYLANSMNSLRIEGQKTISVEITQQLDWEVPDWVVIPGGNLGNVSALGRGYAMMHELGLIDRLPRILLAQAQAANPLYRSYQTGFQKFEAIVAEPTLASAIRIGNPVSVDKAIRVLKTFNGVVEQASEQELADACAMGDATGLYTCPHTGVALAATKKCVDAGVIGKQDKVVVISTAHGLKFSEQKAGYHQRELGGLTFPHANGPVSCGADVASVNQALDQHLNNR